MKFLPFSVFLIISGFAFAQTSAIAQTRKQIVSKPFNQAAPAEKPDGSGEASALEQAVLNEINSARRNPQAYIDYVQEYRKLFKGNTVFLPNFLRIETNEGGAAVDEAIGALRKIAPLNALSFSAGLNKAASLQLADLRENSSLGHTGKNGSSLPQRLQKFGLSGNYAENIAYYAETARDIVLLMIIDDGVKSRPHRKNLFSPNFKVIGIAYGKGKSDEGLCVADFADYFTESRRKSDARQL